MQHLFVHAATNFVHFGTMALLSRTKAFAATGRNAAPTRAVRMVVRASAQQQPRFQVPAAVKPALATLVANVVMAMPAAADAGKLFDFNITLPVMAGEILLLVRRTILGMLPRRGDPVAGPIRSQPASWPLIGNFECRGSTALQQPAQWHSAQRRCNRSGGARIAAPGQLLS